MSVMIEPGSDGFGTDVGIHTQRSNVIQIMHRASFHTGGWCIGDKTRRYFIVLENAYEQNYPVACCAIPPNCCCPGTDYISKYYFDRGAFDQQNCCWAIGFLNGAPSFFPNEVQYSCCCMDAPECWNNCCACLGCYVNCCCGDRVRYLPYENCCWCIPARATCCNNTCGLCGPKTGQPLCLKPVTCCLKPKSAPDLVVAVENARAAWRQRTGKN